MTVHNPMTLYAEFERRVYEIDSWQEFYLEFLPRYLSALASDEEPPNDRCVPFGALVCSAYTMVRSRHTDGPWLTFRPKLCDTVKALVLVAVGRDEEGNQIVKESLGIELRMVRLG